MNLQVHIGQNNERFMLGGDETPETFRVHEEKSRGREAQEQAKYVDWLNGARDYVSPDDGYTVGLAKAHLEEARRLKSPVDEGISCFDSRWSSWSEACYRDIAGLNTAQQVLHHAQSRVPFDHRYHVEGHKEEFAIFEKLVVEEFPFYREQQFALKENPLSIPDTLYMMHGRLVSNVFYWHLRTKFRCQQDIAPRRITEIGGGYGSLARIWLNDPEIVRYVIVDLPESLFFSEVCLKQEGFNVGYFDGVDWGHRVLLVPVGRLAEYTSRNMSACDLVISVGSLQELSDAWVSYYMTWLDELQPKFFYSLNYMGGAFNYMYEGRNFWSPRPSRNWAARSIEADIPLIRMMCSGREFAETIYERGATAGSFSDWSVLRGATYSRRTYLEGLELLRQDFTAANGIQFIEIVLANNDKKKLVVPKEVMLVLASLAKATDEPDIRKVYQMLADAQKFAVR